MNTCFTNYAYQRGYFRDVFGILIVRDTRNTPCSDTKSVSEISPLIGTHILCR